MLSIANPLAHVPSARAPIGPLTPPPSDALSVKVFVRPGFAVTPVERSTSPPKKSIASSMVRAAEGLISATATPEMFAVAEYTGVQPEVDVFSLLRASRWILPSARETPKVVVRSTASEAEMKAPTSKLRAGPSSMIPGTLMSE